jgi:hypothetical protein
VPDDSVRIAAEVADLLRLELFGFFIEEQDLLDLATMPFAREFRPFGGGWNRIDADQLARDLDHASRAARRLFAEAAKDLSTAAHFHTMRGTLAETIASILRTGDIVILAEPAHPAEQAAHRFDALMQAAFASAAAVLVVPRQIGRRSGDVVAIATSPEDPTLAAAATIAAAAGEGLVILETNHPAANVPADAGPRGQPKVVRVRPARAPRSAEEIVAALAGVRDRLLVIKRGAFDDTTSLTLARMRGVPVLVLEPPPR